MEEGARGRWEESGRRRNSVGRVEVRRREEEGGEQGGSKEGGEIKERRRRGGKRERGRERGRGGRCPPVNHVDITVNNN